MGFEPTHPFRHSIFKILSATQQSFGLPLSLNSLTVHIYYITLLLHRTFTLIPSTSGLINYSCEKPDLNWQPSTWQADALHWSYSRMCALIFSRDKTLNNYLSEKRDLNPQPVVWKTTALHWSYSRFMYLL